MTRVHVVVEGQTEEAFVNNVVAQVLWPRGVYLSPIILGPPGHKVGTSRYLMIAGLAIASLLAQPLLVDLVANPPNRGKDRPVTHIVGGRSFHSSSPKPKLPLEVDLLSISLSPSRLGVRIVEISIRNTGPDPYLLPVGREGDTVLEPRIRGRHEARFVLRARADKEPYLFGTSTFGSQDVPGSMLAIPPGGTVRVRFPAHVEAGRVERWKAEGKLQVEVEAGFADWRYEDNPAQYVVNVTEAPEVLSRNLLRLQVE